MALSPSHRFGQILGMLLETIVREDILRPRLERYVESRGFYLDSQGARQARAGKAVAWEDKYGNQHNLDFVIEEGGSHDVRGRPLAFVEAAWRRYTKHSRNKAQEIQGALLPIVERHSATAPFCGVVLAGEFTKASIAQLESQRIAVLYLPYTLVVSAFRQIGVDIAFDESTPDVKFDKASTVLNEMSVDQRRKLRDAILAASKLEIEAFLLRLEGALNRYVKRVIVLPLFGFSMEFADVPMALDALKSVDDVLPGTLVRIELRVEFSNGDEIRGSFSSATDASKFLVSLPGYAT